MAPMDSHKISAIRAAAIGFSNLDGCSRFIGVCMRQICSGAGTPDHVYSPSVNYTQPWCW